MFFTISMGTVDVGTGEWVLCRAGHTSALIIERGGQTTSICGEGMALGAFEHVRLEESRGVLGRGDRLILCSDGLLEALGAESAAGALERLSKMAQSYLGDPLPVLTGAIRRLCESRGRDLQDDASLLVISRP
jgi:serine phosphatase RsbU (regulator of sigma subunit)